MIVLYLLQKESYHEQEPGKGTVAKYNFATVPARDISDKILTKNAKKPSPVFANNL